MKLQKANSNPKIPVYRKKQCLITSLRQRQSSIGAPLSSHKEAGSTHFGTEMMPVLGRGHTMYCGGGAGPF